MDTNDSLSFLALVDRAGMTPMPYSGRGMYGKECLAIELEGSPFVCISELLAEATEDEILLVQKALRSAQTDSLGRGKVFYFTEVEWVDADADEEEPVDSHDYDPR